jgi:UDP-N-acetylglucosamine 2-epimerase
MTKHIVTIVGARPQFVKAAVLSRLIRNSTWKNTFHETLIHTGQHYDDNMSEVFFRDMQIPKPDIHLHIGGGTHGAMTGQMLIEIERELIRLQPDLVLVYGDTNSTLAGALAAAKLHVPLAHVEAGLRSYFKRMPEEQNRVLTDHLSDWLFCPTETAVSNLAEEGIRENVHHVGDIMLDASFFYRELIKREQGNVGSGQENGGSGQDKVVAGQDDDGTGLKEGGSDMDDGGSDMDDGGSGPGKGESGLNDGGPDMDDGGAGPEKAKSRLENIDGLGAGVLSKKYLLATVHRAENTDDPQKLGNIVAALNEMSLPVVLPLHPRTKKLMAAGGLKFSDNVTVIDPVGYLEMLEMEMRCEAVITDSGGVQKEAYFLGKPCVTLREQTEWVETEKSGWNAVVGTDKDRVLKAVEQISRPEKHPDFYGSGDAGSVMLQILATDLNR